MRHFVRARVQFEGFHAWPDAPHEVDFLRDRHRHIFHIEATKAISEDRQTEFILLGRRIRAWVSSAFDKGELGTTSCEELATMIASAFDLSACVVWEDNENGGGVAC